MLTKGYKINKKLSSCYKCSNTKHLLLMYGKLFLNLIAKANCNNTKEYYVSYHFYFQPA